MRIVGGSMRGRTIRPPKGNATRPTTDRVREALFSALTSRMGSDLGGGAVLDVFAGSGALGLEALSRGASSSVFLERDRDALGALKRNIADLKVEDRCRIVVGDAFSLAERGVGGPFALILLDPPYTLDPARLASLLVSLAARGGIEDGAVVTWEHARGYVPEWPEGFEIDARKKYGSTEIDIATYERGAGK